MFKDPKLGQKMAFYGVFYIVFALFIVGGYFAKDYIRPLAAILVPINDKPLWYTFVVLTGMYWGTVLAFETIFKKKSD